MSDTKKSTEKKYNKPEAALINRKMDKYIHESLRISLTSLKAKRLRAKKVQRKVKK